MAITYVDDVTVEIDQIQNELDVVALPTSLTGDVWIIQTTYSSYSHSDQIGTWVDNNGWTEITTSPVTDPNMALVYKRMGGTPDTSVQIENSNGVAGVLVGQLFRGVDKQTQFDVDYELNTSASGSPNTPSITTISDNCLIVSIGALDKDEVTSVTAPSGYTNLTWLSSTQGIGQDSTGMMSSKFLADFGTEDPGPYTTSGNDDWVGHTIALRPAPLQLGPFDIRIGPVADTAGRSGTLGIDIDFPVGTENGDLLLLFGYRRQGADWVTPDDWTNRLTAIDGAATSGNPRVTGIWWKYATSIETGGSGMTLKHSSSSTQPMAAVVIAIRGAELVDPLDVTPTASHYTEYEDKATTNANAFDSITTVTDNTLVLGFEALQGSAITSADPTMSGYDLLVNHAVFSDRNFWLWGKNIATAGAESPGTPNLTSSAATADGSTATFAIRSRQPVGLLKWYDSYRFGGLTASNNVTMTIPKNTVEDDLMVAVLSTTDFRSAVITPPSGWTLEMGPIDETGGASNPVTWVYRRTADAADEIGADEDTYTWVFTGGEEQAGVMLGFDGGEWGEEAIRLFTGDVTSIDSPTVTTTVDDEMVFWAALRDVGNDFTGTPAGVDRLIVSETFGAADQGGAAFGLTAEEYPSPGATGGGTWTLELEQAQAFTFSVRPSVSDIPKVGVDAFTLAEAAVAEAQHVGTDSFTLSEASALEQLFAKAAADAFTLVEAAVKQGIAEQFGTDSFALSEGAFSLGLGVIGVDSAALTEAASLTTALVSLDLSGDDHLIRLNTGPGAPEDRFGVGLFQKRQDYRYSGRAVICEEVSSGVWTVSPYPGLAEVPNDEAVTADHIFYGGRVIQLDDEQLYVALLAAGYTFT